MYYFTSDEHYGHKNILKFCNRPFSSVFDMDETLINNHNSIVCDDDTTIHVGDFTLCKNRRKVQLLIDRLNGNHIFIKGSHDYWLPKKHNIQIWEKTINDVYIVACHYAMRVWSRSHYGSWHVYGHSHGKLPSFGKSYDVGVDNNYYFPISFIKLTNIMNKLDDNFNLIPRLCNKKDI